MAQSVRRGRYRALYDAKKLEYLARGWSKARAHRAGLRYMTQKLLTQFWRQWRASIDVSEATKYRVLAVPPEGAVTANDIYDDQDA